jgi:hypothetical protein
MHRARDLPVLISDLGLWHARPLHAKRGHPGKLCATVGFVGRAHGILRPNLKRRAFFGHPGRNSAPSELPKTL